MYSQKGRYNFFLKNGKVYQIQYNNSDYKGITYVINTSKQFHDGVMNPPDGCVYMTVLSKANEGKTCTSEEIENMKNLESDYRYGICEMGVKEKEFYDFIENYVVDKS